jgi:predicted MFS family arabinose efflux permease
MMGLLALAMSGFITILTETLPAGLLPQIGAGLLVSRAWVGQLVTAYAIGSLVAAIPLTAATHTMRRRSLLLIAIGGFAVANMVTAVSGDYHLTMAARFGAGMSAGLLWALLAGYAARMAPPHLTGRAVAVAMAGTPLALALGVPLGTWLGVVLGWRASFAIMSALSLCLIGWVLAAVPDFPGQTATTKRFTLYGALSLPGVSSVLIVMLAFVLAHNILYTYIRPVLDRADLGGSTDRVLLIFGLTALTGIWAVGMLIDRWLRALALSSIVLFGLAVIVLLIWGCSPFAVYAAAGIWGLAFGGAATLFQTALANQAGEAGDVAQSILVTVWNLAIAGGGLVGGLLLDAVGVGAFPLAPLALLTLALVATLRARRHGFPPARRP